MIEIEIDRKGEIEKEILVAFIIMHVIIYEIYTIITDASEEYLLQL